MSGPIVITSFAQSAGGSGILSTLLMFGAMFAILYFILIRPQQKQQKKHQALLAALKKGDEVILSSGIMGKVFAVEDRVVIIEINDKTKFRVLKQAVQGLVGPSEGDTASLPKPKDQGPVS
ncbi:MAG TPA: preprotein translocase subunit YajC [Myxococcota bacterium]|nr:preprotein translocase subunit YajC [Myxococcota bacterium]